MRGVEINGIIFYALLITRREGNPLTTRADYHIRVYRRAKN